MRIVHTADWHAGRIWKNLNRLNETENVLDHLARFLEREKVDLLLVAGDVFDSINPGADAERVVFEFFKRIGRNGISSVVIAGNHDNPLRMDAWGMLAELVHVHTVGRPRGVKDGGTRKIQTANGETAIVAALPFANPGVFVSALELAEGDTIAKSLYADRFKQAVAHLASGFRPKCVNLLMAHTHLNGAQFGESERRVHLGDDWAAEAQAFPAAVQYVALGHIHKPQEIAAPAPTRYSGSPLQLDFGEAGQAKSFVLIEAKPGQPVRTELIPFEGGTQLCRLRLTLGQVEERLPELKSAGWLDLTVPLAEPDPELARKIRKHLPNALGIRPELPEQTLSQVTFSLAGKKAIDLYRDYCMRERGRVPQEETEAAFQNLYEQYSGE